MPVRGLTHMAAKVAAGENWPWIHLGVPPALPPPVAPPLPPPPPPPPPQESSSAVTGINASNNPVLWMETMRHPCREALGLKCYTVSPAVWAFGASEHCTIRK